MRQVRSASVQAQMRWPEPSATQRSVVQSRPSPQSASVSQVTKASGSVPEPPPVPESVAPEPESAPVSTAEELSAAVSVPVSVSALVAGESSEQAARPAATQRRARER